ncbi:uncharacterized protein LOC134668474 [Cydia fagiglandana]|uniref:uncharacterized protein LOC134668474 n=1 Tax=Cydia fagiglandana TaxID=1458189 RepID=UPI002FEE1E70
MKNHKVNPAKYKRVIAILILTCFQCYAAVIKIEGLKFMMNGVPMTLQFTNQSQDNRKSADDDEIVANVTIDAVEINDSKVITEGNNLTKEDISKDKDKAVNRNPNHHTSDDNEIADKSLRKVFENPSVYVPISEDVANPEFIPHGPERKQFRDGLALIDSKGGELSVQL